MKELRLFTGIHSVWGKIDDTYLKTPLPIPQDFSHSSRVSAFAHVCIFSWADCPHVPFFDCGTSIRFTRSVLVVALPSAPIHLNFSLVNTPIFCIMLMRQEGSFWTSENVDIHRPGMIERRKSSPMALLFYALINLQYLIKLIKLIN